VLVPFEVGSDDADNHDDEIGLRKVSEACVGYDASDLSALVRRAAMLRMEEQLTVRDGSKLISRRSLAITPIDLFLAMDDVGAFVSTRRGTLGSTQYQVG
jgi:SpoVK/Ycf46/Vps4 family AAA+-type ATPase